MRKPGVHFPTPAAGGVTRPTRGNAPSVERTSDHEWAVGSSSRAGVTHRVTGDGESWSCDCEAYQFRGRCMHIDAAKGKG